MMDNRIASVIQEVVLSSNYNEAEFKRLVNKEIQHAFKEKNKQDDDVKMCFDTFLSNYEKKKQKALSFLK